VSEPGRGEFGQDVPGIVRAFAVVRERWWVIAVAAGVTVAAALALSLSATKQYDATSKLLFRQSNLSAQVGGAGAAPDTDPEATKSTNVRLVTTNEVAAAVRRQLKLRLSDSELQGKVTVAPEETSYVVDVTARDESPQLAAQIANAWTQQFEAYAKRSARAKVQEGQNLIRQRIAALPPDATRDRDLLEQSLSQLIRIEAVQTGDVDVVDRAQVPTAAATPKPKRDAAIALVLGGLLGVGLAFGLNALDRRLKTVEEFERAYGLRALASVPARSRDPRTQRDRQAALEPFRILRNALSFFAVEEDIRVVMVTSAAQGEGKSTVSAGLARALALSGQTCVLVECDLRRPTFHQQFDLNREDGGLTTALVSGAPVAGLVRTVLPGLRTLMVLPSGPVPPNAAELLRSGEFTAVISDLKDMADVIVLDAPPLLPVADAQVLADNPVIDIGLIVGRAFQTTREEARRTRAILDRHRLKSLGLVVNGLRQSELDYEYESFEGNATNADVPLS
jgi:capsular exopolysaccharide synthesis family protein